MNYFKPYYFDDSNRHFQISNLGFRPVVDVPKICPRFVQRHGTFTRSNTIIKHKESKKNEKKKEENKDQKIDNQVTDEEQEEQNEEDIANKQNVENLDNTNYK